MRIVAFSAAVLAIIAGCASQRHTAPVEERRATAPPATASAASAAASASSGMPPGGVPAVDLAKTPPGVENAGKPGYYTVKPGDTMIRIGLETGQNWRDIQRWNNLDNPNVIEVGQVLRVAPPGVDPSAVTAKGVATSKVEGRPLDSKLPSAPASAASAPPAAASVAAAAAATSVAAAATPPAVVPAVPATSPPSPNAPRDGDEEIAWAWPATGPIVATFDEARYKGLAISGKLGDPVLAAADGRVVYAGSGLRGYGNLVIVKHNNTYLTAYAHNQTLLVKEDQPVRRGQKIAEMGSSDTDRVQLHFEIRRQGKPIDPTRLLPQR
jgi:lipoprotein NlpD